MHGLEEQKPKGKPLARMRKIKTEQKEVEVETLEYLQCDLCKRKAINDDWQAMDFPIEGGFQVNDVTVEFREGKVYPEGGYGTKLSVDMCPDCFKDKLIVWLKEQGVQVKEEDWSI